jgi:integrase
MTKKRDPWTGGYVRRTKRGKPVYVIERWQGGSRIHVSTGCNTLPAAMKELERFEKDPYGYVPGGNNSGAVRMTAELILAFRDFQLAKGLTREWTDEVARCLASWAEVVGPRDLRGLDLHRDLKPAIGTWKTRRPHRIKAIKGFYRWMVEERGLISSQQDPTVRLRVPQAKPEKWRKRKVVPFESVQAVYHHLTEVTRDVMLLSSATALHISEIRRFAESGELEAPLEEGALAVFVVRHKTGGPVKKALRLEEQVEAAKRLRARGGLPKRMTLARHMTAACEAAGVPLFGLGQMRHSVLTWGVKAGASVAEAAQFANHSSETTTKRHYLDLETPATIALPELVAKVLH